jgi:hypothetical protein
MRPVRADGDGMDLEGEARGVEFRVEVAGFLGFFNGTGNTGDPFAHDLDNAVANNSQSAVVLKRRGREEAAALENSFFDKRQPVIDQGPQAGHARGRGNGRQRHFVDENLAGHLYCGEL